MPSLTDEQIVRRIAKFMGWHDDGGGALRLPNSDGFLNWTDFQYLTSYDALAEVMGRAARESKNSNVQALRVFLQVPETVRESWFLCPPREHAEAIAVALGDDE